MTRKRMSAVVVARTVTLAATLAPWSKAKRAETWLAAKAPPTPRRIRIPARGESFAPAALA
jgi:hypothetical protein